MFLCISGQLHAKFLEKNTCDVQVARANKKGTLADSLHLLPWCQLFLFGPCCPKSGALPARPIHRLLLTEYNLLADEYITNGLADISSRQCDQYYNPYRSPSQHVMSNARRTMVYQYSRNFVHRFQKQRFLKNTLDLVQVSCIQSSVY